MRRFNILLLCGLIGLPFTAFCQGSYPWNQIDQLKINGDFFDKVFAYQMEVALNLFSID